MNEVMFVTGGELLQFLPISSKKRVGMSICFFGHLKEEKYGAQNETYIED